MALVHHQLIFQSSVGNEDLGASSDALLLQFLRDLIGELDMECLIAPQVQFSKQRAWTGLVGTAIRSARSQPGPSFKPGVVVISCGRNRAEILEAVVRRGLANQLILDEDAAVALAERLRPRSRSKRTAS